MYKRQTISEEEIRRQRAICGEIFERINASRAHPLAMVDTYGCQQNEADSEKIRGYLAEMGYGFTQNEFDADIIVVNTCAVREHAEMRVLGNVGALNHTKKAKPEQIIAVCGCMVQQEHMTEKIRKSYPIVDLVFGPHELWRFPELLLDVMTRHKRIFATAKADGAVTEGIPLKRDGTVRRDRGHTAEKRRHGKSMAFHHVWMQQFLHVLHCTVRTGKRTLSTAGRYCRRSEEACGGRV